MSKRQKQNRTVQIDENVQGDSDWRDFWDKPQAKWVTFSCLGLFVSWMMFTFYNTPLAEFGINQFTGQPSPRMDLYFTLLMNPSIYFDYWTGTNELGQAPALGIFDRLPIFAMILFYLFVCYRLGVIAISGLSRLGVQRNLFVCCEYQLFSLGIGLSLMSTFVLIYGWCGFLHETMFFKAILVIVTFLSLKTALGRFKQVKTESTEVLEVTSDQPEHAEKDKHWNRWLILGIPFVAIVMLGGVLRAFEFDVREYHLQVPKEWFVAGKVTFMPHNVYGNMPLGIEMHSLAGMMIFDGEYAWLKGAIFGKTIGSLYAIFAAAGLYCLGIRFGSTFIAVISSLLYISIPWTIKLSIGGFNEPGYACYLLFAFYGLAVFCHLHQKQSQLPAGADRSSFHWGFVFLSGFFAGSAFATKYPALLTVCFPCLFIGIVVILVSRGKSMSSELSHSKLKVSLRYFLIFCFAASLSATPWLSKNLVKTGNPTYPLLASVFNATASPEATRSNELIERWNAAHSVSPEKLALPNLFRSAKRMMFDCPWLSPLVGPLLLISIAVLFLGKDLRLLGWIGFGFSLIFVLVWWGLTHQIDRFFFPLLPLLCLLAGLGAAIFRDKVWRYGVVGFLCFAMAANLAFASSRVVGDVRFFVQLDELNPAKENGLEFHGLNQLKPIFAYLNHRSAPDTVLMIGEAAVFDAEFDVVYNTCFDRCIGEQIFKGRSDDEIRQELDRRNISHIVFNWAELNRYRNTYGYSDFVTRSIAIELIEKGIIREIDVPNGLGAVNEQLFRVLP